MDLYNEKDLIWCGTSLVCTCFNMPPYGIFTIGKIYGFVYTEKYIEIVDNNSEIVFLDKNDFNMYFNQIGEVATSVFHPIMNDNKIYSIYLILEQDTCNLDEIKAYSKILNLNYVKAKYALKNKQNLIASGNACEIKEILYKLKQFKVHYEIKPPYPY